MVDYEERDTKRGLREFEEDDEESASTDPENGDREATDEGVASEDGTEPDHEEEVVDIDVIRHELEIRPDAREETGDDETGTHDGHEQASRGRDQEESSGVPTPEDHHERDENRSQRDGHGRNDVGHRQDKGPEKQGGHPEKQSGHPEQQAEHPEQGGENHDHHTHGEPESKDHVPGTYDHQGHDGHSDHDAHDHDAHDHDHDAHANDHDHHAHDVETLRAAVVTVSSTRTMKDDPSGEYLVSTLLEAGHEVVSRELIADDFEAIQHTVEALVGRTDVELVVTTGGTGVTPDDQTVEAIQPLFDKELPGFGELFRALSYEEIGARTVATRATAGVANGVPIFCLPGSRNAVELGTDEIILEVGPHVAGLATRDEG